MRIDEKKNYIRTLEGALITAGKGILRIKCPKKFVFLKYKDINNLLEKYMKGALIRQASFDNEPLTSQERRVVNTMKIVMNKNHVFIYEWNIVEKIKKKDKRIIAKFVEKKEGK